ncbi:DUF4326 domain-containing protein [Sphaerisporangium sp. TRM90804]|uniref:DUF4326 domain-containing protein n=1 Tax=Sphaerisporangium sp. TRM90804 TaxID=3031113 RepID=UPI00244A6FF4|nr:DUF4326 domain-containing protein [Sphaerisporangium sp. TRM90804]MDH2424796.1 DUF4326 domain-containing protein [Sphaerisporangium sp. TRM90804]
MPERIQLRRTAGWRKPPGAVVVSRPSRFGNPFTVGGSCDDPLYRNAVINGSPLARQGVVEDRAHAVALYAFWLMAKVPYTQADIRRELGGRDLACWCPLPEPGQPDYCHAAVLLKIANAEDADDA